MSNVKEGDLAKIIPGCAPAEATGAHVFVVEQARAKSIIDAIQIAACAHKHGGPIWEVECLQPICGGGLDFEPGQRIYASDTYLRRIDPPEDAEDLWQNEPLPGEVSRETEKLG